MEKKCDRVSSSLVHMQALHSIHTARELQAVHPMTGKPPRDPIQLPCTEPPKHDPCGVQDIFHMGMNCTFRVAQSASFASYIISGTKTFWCVEFLWDQLSRSVMMIGWPRRVPLDVVCTSTRVSTCTHTPVAAAHQ